MKYFTNINHIAQTLLGKQKNRLHSLIRFVLLLFIIQHSSFTTQKADAQCSNTPSVMAKWDFDDAATECNGWVDPYPSGYGLPKVQTIPILNGGTNYFCPDQNAGCALTQLGSTGFSNTNRFNYSLCLSGYWDGIVAGSAIGWDPNDTQFHPEIPGNIAIKYTIPKGTAGSITGFSIQILQQQFGGLANYEKQGVAVYRNGVLIPGSAMTAPISPSNINGTPITITFPALPELYSNGAKNVNFKVVFGLVHRLVDYWPNYNASAVTGYDNICLLGVCGGSPEPTAEVLSATCATSGANADGKIILSNFGSTDHYDYNVGTSYTGGKSYATATLIPMDGTVTNTLPNPASPTTYTVRVFTAAGCTKDLQIVLDPVSCPVACPKPTAIVTATDATCGASTANNDAQIAVTGITGGDKVGLSVGATYAGPLYGAAQAATSTYTFTGLSNPSLNQTYTVRVFNGDDGCFQDYQVVLNETSCGPCKKIGAEIISSDNADPNSTPNSWNSTEDDFASYEMCKGAAYIDLKLTKSVTPTTGTTCPINTDFIWTLTLTNAGTMPATNIHVKDYIPADLIKTVITPSVGSYSSSLDIWEISSLANGASATLNITTKTLKAGSYQNCAEVMEVTETNDPNSTPGNHLASEDDLACASITVTGTNVPEITKEFSPMSSAPNIPIKLIIKITNNAATPITTTAALVDNLPSSPAQLVIAPTPNLTTGLTGVIATAGGTSITIPSGTVLRPGLNQISVDVVPPSAGIYCNVIAAGALKTTSCDNLTAAEACMDINADYELAPMVSKTMLPATIQTGQNATLTINIENRNASVMTLNKDFVDYLPAGLVANGSVSSSCGGATLQNSNTEIKIAAGTTIAASSICTITVPVTSNTAGTYCNQILMNAINVSVGTNLYLYNTSIAEACVTAVSTPCTALSAATITPATATVAPGGTVSLSASATGAGASTVYNWSAASGSFAPQTAATTFTAPMTPGMYTVTVSLDNSLTGYGVCTTTATAAITVSAAACDISLLATQGPCLPSNNQYSLTGELTFYNPPASGTLTVSDGAITEVFTAPFISPQAYTLSGLTADGVSHTVTAVFSGDVACTNTANYTAPASCGVSCVATQTHTIPVCNNNGTTSTASDDWFAFSVTGTLTNGSGNYIIKIGAFTSTSVPSGNAITITGNGLSGNPTLAANGSATYVVRVEDNADSTCFSEFIVGPVAACSNCPTPNCGTVTVQKN